MNIRISLFLVTGMAVVAGFQYLAGASTVHAHEGLAAGQNPMAAWSTNPIPSFGLILAAYLYLTGLSRWHRPTHPISRWQRISFFSGLVVVFIALQSPIDPIAEHMFSFHQLQHILIRMVAPLLILGGAPLTPMLRGLPHWVLQGVVRPIVSNSLARSAYYRLTNPVVATIIFLGILYLWQVPVNMNLALRNELVHQFMHLTMTFSGFLFYWLIIDPKPHRSRMHYGLRVLYLGLIVIPNTMLGVALVFAETPIYSAYVEAGQLFGMSIMTDQQLGGLMLWVPGDMMSILAAGVVMILWYQKEEEQSALEAARREANVDKSGPQPGG